MGNSNVVLYQRTPLFRTLSKNIEARPKTKEGQPLPTLAAFCLVYTGLDQLSPVFVRQPETWKPPHTGELKGLVRDFVRHTLVRYPMPEFMYKVWDSDNVLHQQWFIHLGAGRNLRKADALPFAQPITKMHAHHFCAAPSWMQVEQALRYGQVLSMGGSVRLAKAVATSRIGTVLDTTSDAFWKAVLSQFIKNPDLSATQVRAVIEKWYQLFWVPQYVVSASGRMKLVAPDESLNPVSGGGLPEILALLSPSPELIGQRGGVPEEQPFPKFSETWKRKAAKVRELWPYDIQQLRTTVALREEGRKMNHCVATYTNSCRRGRTFIFAFKNVKSPFSASLLTVEVRQNRQIIQVKGPANRQPTPNERQLVRYWAQLAGVNPDCWDMREEHRD